MRLPAFITMAVCCGLIGFQVGWTCRQIAQAPASTEPDAIAYDTDNVSCDGKEWSQLDSHILAVHQLLMGLEQRLTDTEDKNTLRDAAAILRVYRGYHHEQGLKHETSYSSDGIYFWDFTN